MKRQTYTRLAVSAQHPRTLRFISTAHIIDQRIIDGESYITAWLYLGWVARIMTDDMARYHVPVSALRWKVETFEVGDE